MTHFKKILLGFAVSSTALVTLPANAVAISFGGQMATDGSGLTSALVPASNTGLGAGYFIETFDPATAGPGFAPGLAAPGNASIPVAAGCSVNSFGSLNITPGGGGFSVQSGSTVGVAAAPAGNTTCFGFGPRQGGSLPASVLVDYSPVLAPGVKISYLGLYYGSIDTYNNINLYDNGTLFQTITGASVLAATGGRAGDRTLPGSNVYVNFDFSSSEAFTAFEFVTTGVAFELDNVVVGLTNRPTNDVPEPGSLALLGVGLFGLVAARRRQRKS